MALIILVPAVACWAVLAIGSARKALLNVYLPTLLLLPQYYVLRVKHLPPLTFADAAIVPLGIALAAYMRRWRFAWMDLWVLLLAASAGFSEALSTQMANGGWVRLLSPTDALSPLLNTSLANGGLMFVDGLMTIVLPYMAGKLLIEDNRQAFNAQGREAMPMRRKFVSRMVALLALVAALSVYDFLSGGSLWQKAARHFLLADQNEIWEPQVRWGFGRVAGPFGHAILAGMIFLMGLIYCLWLRRADPKWGARRLLAGLPITGRGLVLFAVAAGLLMTQSRGPWLGVGLALIFALLTRYLSIPKAAIAFLLFLAAFGSVAYYAGKRYTDHDLNAAVTVEQRNAIYRRELLASYSPLVEQRPAFGWGITTYPAVNGQKSIDNEYLLLAVTEGLTGLLLFLFIVAGTAGRLLHWIAHPMERPIAEEDRLLVFAHLAVLIGLATTLGTVYMGEQVVMLFFLFSGWVQGMNPALRAAPAEDGLRPAPRYRHVLV